MRTHVHTHEFRVRMHVRIVRMHVHSTHVRMDGVRTLAYACVCSINTKIEEI